MSSVDSSNYYNSLSDLQNSGTTTKVRTVTSTQDGDKVTEEGDSSIFSSSNKLGKTDFLNLLVTQMKYQDPMEPTDNTEYVAQLAQFSQLENSQNVSTSMDSLTKSMTSFMNMQTLNSQSATNASTTALLGKQVRVSQSELDHKGGKTDFKVHLGSGVDSAKLVIRDSKDKVIASLDVSAKDNKTGADVAVSWDGKNTEGKIALSGAYTLEVVKGDGTTSAGYIYNEGVVNGLNYENSTARILVGGKEYAVGSLVSVTEKTSTTETESAT